MGNEASCPTCQGKGSIAEKQPAGMGGALAGAVVGGTIAGPLGAVIGGVAGSVAQIPVTCSRCNGSGKISTTSPTSSAFTPRGWHNKGGKMMKMYHGTTAANAQSIMRNGFNPSSTGMLGQGVYLSADIDKAKNYGSSILTVDVKLGKTKKIDSQSHPLRTSWNSHGYDSAWVPANCGMVSSGLTETCVFDPDRIRVTSCT